MPISANDIKAIIAAEAGRDVADLKPDQTLIDLDISSLDVVSALFVLEDEYGIEIEPDAIAPTATISDFIEHVLNLSAK